MAGQGTPIKSARRRVSQWWTRLAWDFGPGSGSTHQAYIDGGDKPLVSAGRPCSGSAVATAARAQTHNCRRVKVRRLCPIPDKAAAEM